MYAKNEISTRLWILGEQFRSSSDGTIRRVRSFLRFTYRKDFPTMIPYGITSDAGWGCMLRSAQTLMANVFLRHFLGEHWLLPEDYDSIQRLFPKYFEILSWFIDIPGLPHFFALHHMVQCGIKYNKLPGEWFGPSTVALVLRDISRMQNEKHDTDLIIHVTSSDTIYRSDILKLLCLESEVVQPEVSEIEIDHDPLLHPIVKPKQLWEPSKSLLVLIPVMLGLSTTEAKYFSELKKTLMHPACCGILGGKVNHALYFVGYDDEDNLLGLDPHTVFASPSMSTYSETEISHEFRSQIHVSHFDKLSISKLDSSLALSFYFRNQDEFDNFFDEYSNNCESDTKLFFVSEVSPSYEHIDDCSFDDDEKESDDISSRKPLEHKVLNVDQNYDIDDDEYVTI